MATVIERIPNYAIEDLIKDCLDDFDFDKVYFVMRSLDWKWFSHDTESVTVPSTARMRKTAARLLRSAYYDDYLEHNGDSGFAATGGFEAEFREVFAEEGVFNTLRPMENGSFTLRFVVESKHTYGA